MSSSPTLDLHKFSEAFKSEDDLRKKLQVLLTRMPRTQGVEITHGTQEYGKDIIFYSPDGFDEWVLNACVVKNEKISGSADDSAGARNIFHQVEQALDTPLVKSTGEEVRVARVYVISPFDCPQTTMRSIQGKLMARSGQVDFLCGYRLLEKFAKYWAEFIAFESTLLGSYVASLQRGFDESDPVNFLMAQHNILAGAGKTLGAVYVRQGFTVALRQVAFLVELPDLTFLQDPVMLKDVNELNESLQFVSNFIAQPQSWEEVEDLERPGKIAAALTDLGEQVRKHWLRQWDEHKKKSEAVGKSAVPKNSAKLKLESLGTAKWRPILAEIKGILHTFSRHVHTANIFAGEASNLIANLDSPEYLNYCRVHEVVRLLPTAFRHLKPRRLENLPDDLLETSRAPLLITAPAGHGKTSFCKWNVLNDVSSLAADASKTIPVYVPLHQLATAKLATAEEVFFRTSEIKQLVATATSRKRKVRLYLDGLDEVPSSNQQRLLIDLAKNLALKAGIQIIVTGRDYVSGPWLRWLSRVRLSQLTEAQVAKLISNWLGDNPTELNKFNGQLDKSRSLKPLMRVPLLGTLIIAVFKKLKSLPENRVKLYEIFVDLMCGGWDFAKNITRESRFGLNTKLRILTRLAGLLHSSDLREAREGDFEKAVLTSMPGLNDRWRSLLDEVLEDGLLVRTGATLAFSHLSFQEFLVAKDLNDPKAARQQQVLRAFLAGNDWWREVLSFYLAMDKRPDEMEAWILHASAKPPNEKTVYDLQSRYEFLLGCLTDSYVGWMPKQSKLPFADGAKDALSSHTR